MTGSTQRLEEALAPLGRPIATEVGRVLRERAGPAAAHAIVELEALEGNHVMYRLHASANGNRWSLILKQVEPDVAQRNRLAVQRWLPWLELDHLAPALHGAAASRGVQSIWQVYEDVPGTTLQECRSDRELVGLALDRVAELHIRAGGHPVVAECRRHGQDLGMHYFMSNVSDAARLLERLRPPQVQPSPEQVATRDRLLRRLRDLLCDGPRRARLVEEVGTPDTMLHGDLWTTNILVQNVGDRTSVRLIDWDRVGAGPFCYDLSILLYRFPTRDRPWMVERYRNAVASGGWRLPPTSDLNVLFHTFECARYANRIVWPAIAVLRESAEWGWDELCEIAEWFRALDSGIHE